MTGDWPAHVPRQKSFSHKGRWKRLWHNDPKKYVSKETSVQSASTGKKTYSREKEDFKELESGHVF